MVSASRAGEVKDVVIVGGGHNGLACAAYLARAGLDVLVLERRDVLGGAAVTEEPWPGYRISSASYVVSLLPPRIVRELDLERHGYRVSLVTPDYFVPFPDGSGLTLWGDTTRDAAEISRFSAADAGAYLEFDRHFERVARLLKDLLFVVPPNLALAELPKWAAVGARLRGWTGRDVAEAVRLFTMSAADFLDEWFEDPRVKGALATQAIIGAWCGPMSPGSAYVLMHHWIGEVSGHQGAWGWVHGGMGGVSGALARSAQAAGAEVRTTAPVRRVTIRDGRATGVELGDGSHIAARRVVSSAHPVTTYRDLVGFGHLPDEVVRDVKRLRTRSGSVKVNLALSALPQPTAWDDSRPEPLHRGLMAISPSVEYLERAWDDAKYGRSSRHPYLEMVFPTAHEPGLAPDGRHIALAFTQYGPFELAEGSWETERAAYLARVLETVEEYCPGFTASVLHDEVLAPPDIEERYGLLGGNIFQGEMTPDQMLSLRPIFGYGDYRSPVAGLYLCGSGTHPGGGVMAAPARNASRAILADVRRERLRTRLRRR
ncbi:MAG TPA: NAD(P)/FAD-dependent oxidoreductase [Streptosporangiaceae bacterium]|nr:NAD(P)/FAD-dependent oxidoreductase [Streptosporangiaceae bacterium]